MRTYTSNEIERLLQGKKVLIASCEAGAAQILSSLVKDVGLTDASFVLEGPAVRIFQAKLGAIDVKNYSLDLFEQCDLVMTGTSLIPELERNAIACAKAANKPVIAVVDHWVNYRRRFTPLEASQKISFETFLPDEIWVTDKYAYDIAIAEQLPQDRLRLIDNFYLLDLKDKLMGLAPDDAGKNVLLYVCEPVFDDTKILYGDGNKWGYNEFDLMEDLSKSLNVLEQDFDKFVVRVHPNEKRDKYDPILRSYRGRSPVEISSYETRSIELECLNADCIVGVESMALVIGLLAGKKVFSCLPSGIKKTCSLPHREIARIHSVAEILGVRSR